MSQFLARRQRRPTPENSRAKNIAKLWVINKSKLDGFLFQSVYFSLYTMKTIYIFIWKTINPVFALIDQ